MKNDWKETLVPPGANISTAAEVLTTSSMRIALVVDDMNRLLGTVTDGDIRRAMAYGQDMNSTVSEIMQKNPTTVKESEERQKILQLMREKDLLHLPIIDSVGKVVGLEIMQNFIFDAPRSNTVLLMAGGFGSRLYPLTRDVPKPLLPIGEKPILETILEQLVEAGFSRFFLAVHYKSDQVRKHFGDGSSWGVAIEYLEEDQPLGTAGALGLLEGDTIDQPLLMMNADLLTRLNFGQLLDYHTEHGGAATMCVREYDFQIPYGVVQGDGLQVQDITEKPVQKYFVNAGIYILEPELVAQCKGKQVKDMPDLLRATVRGGGKVNMFPIHEYWLDIGRMEEYERAQVEGPGLVT
jgi:dTDP-glucose pyrophosphorylase